MNSESRKASWRNFHKRKKEKLAGIPGALEVAIAQKAAYDKEYRERNKEKRKVYKADPTRMWRWNAIRRDKYKATRAHPRRIRTKEEIQTSNRQSWNKYGAKNREKRRQYARKYSKHRRLTDASVRILSNLRRRVSLTIKREVKSARTMALIGCTRVELKAHLESLFKPGMTWGNYGHGGWVVDHKNPCSGFDMSDADQQNAAFHFSNLQPLWHHENLTKSDTLPDGTRARHIRKLSASQPASD